MRTIILLFFSTLLLGAATYELDQARRVDWSLAGVPGGIPHRTTIAIHAYLSGCDKTGVTNCAPLANSLINSCPSNQFVYFPAGTYRFSDLLNIGHYVDGGTIRGDGMGQTIFVHDAVGGNGFLTIGGFEARSASTLNITSGATKGSSNVVLDSVSGLVVGKLARLDQLNPSWVVEYLTGTGRGMSTIARIEAINGNTMTFWPPLMYDLTNSPAVGLVGATYLLERYGIEGITFNMSNSPAGAAIFMQTAYQCWVKDCEVVGSLGRQIWSLEALQCEFRSNYLHAVRGGGPNHEGLDFYRDGCWNLVEDNISDNGGFPSIIVGDSLGGCVGNVIAYNYVTNVDTAVGQAGAAISVNHGPHNMMNLLEGNVVNMIQSDGYYGSASHNTFFRNYSSGTGPSGITDARKAIDLCRWSYWHNIIGNVFGSPEANFHTCYDIETNGFAYAVKTIYRLGFPAMGHNSYSGTNPPSSAIDNLDHNVTNTLLRVANFDYFTSGIPTLEQTNAVLPASLFRTAKPDWFGNISWPPIGPDLSPLVSTIPAQMRHSGAVFPYYATPIPQQAARGRRSFGGAVGP